MKEKSIFQLLEIEDTQTKLHELSQLQSIDTTVVNDAGQTPLHLAVLANQIEVAAILLSKGFSPNTKDNNQLSPFIAAAANGFSEMFDLILTYHPDVTNENRFGGTALLPSSEKGFINVVHSALKAGVPVNHKNKLGWSALLEAVILGNEGFLFRDIVEALITHGADPAIKDFDGKTAIDYAREKNHQTILSILETGVSHTSFTDVKEKINNKHYFESIQALLAMEESTEQLYYLGFSYEQLNRFEAALFYYEKGFAQDNQFAYYLANLAKKVNETDLAFSYFNDGAKRAEDHVFFDYHKSNYLREKGYHQEAIDVMDHLLSDDSKRVDYLFHKANSLKSLSKYEEAYEAMTLASNYQPNNKLFADYAKELYILKGGV